jgi:hypothetical protein
VLLSREIVAVEAQDAAGVGEVSGVRPGQS